MKQARRMELIKLHIYNSATRPPSHGNAVTGGAIWVGRVQVDLAGPTAGEYRKAGTNGNGLVG